MRRQQQNRVNRTADRSSRRRDAVLSTVESLEDRQLMSATYTVTSTSDASTSAGAPGTLRWAIQHVNQDLGRKGTDVINFKIGSGAQTITLSRPLPAVNQPVVIDGTTQSNPQHSTSPLITIDGKGIPVSAGPSGLVLMGKGSTVQDLAIDHVEEAIVVRASGDLIQNNALGLHPTTVKGVDYGLGTGVDAYAGVTITGNTIEHGDEAGILMESGASNSTVARNHLEENATGIRDSAGSNSNSFYSNTVLSSFQDGIEIRGTNNHIGTGFDSGKNTIGDEPFNTPEGNYVGVFIGSSGNYVLDNKIYFSKFDGIQLGGNNNFVQGNDVFESGAAGIELNGASGNYIGAGGPTGVGGNTISYSGNEGVNFYLGSSHNTVTQNTIINNMEDGAFIASGCNFNTFRENTMSGNNTLNIDLGHVTPGGNQGVPATTLLGAYGLGLSGTNNVTGTYQGVANAHDRVEFFSSNKFVGYISLTTNSQGYLASASAPAGSGMSVTVSGTGANANYIAYFSTANVLNTTLTATVTDSNGNTSQYSNAVTVNFVKPIVPPGGFHLR